jgi:hypothetical protein
MVMRIVRAAGLAVILITVAARFMAAQAVERRAAVAADVSVRVWLPSGSLRLIGWDRDSIVVTGAVGAGETLFFAGDARAMRFGVEEPAAGRAAQPSQLTAYIPRGGRVSVRTSSASIDATDLSGAFTSITGSIRIAGVATDIQADAVDGALDVNVNAPMVRVRTGGGDLAVGGSVGDLGAASVSGDLRVATRDLVRARLESTTGSITFMGDFGKGGTIEIDNHAGLVDLRLPFGMRVDLRATTVAGTITNTMTTDQPMKGGSKLGESLSMLAGSGWPRVIVRSFKGEVLVRYR